MRVMCNMGCGQSKSSASKSCLGEDKDPDNNYEVYDKAKSSADSMKKKSSHGSRDPMVPSMDEMRNRSSHSSTATDSITSIPSLHRAKSGGGPGGGGGQGLSNGDVRGGGTDGDNKENNRRTARSAFKDKGNSGPLQSTNPSITDSQMDFFRMLDEKIESGKDYESEDMES